jgi:hypothetical protein
MSDLRSKVVKIAARQQTNCAFWYTFFDLWKSMVLFYSRVHNTQTIRTWIDQKNQTFAPAIFHRFLP